MSRGYKELDFIVNEKGTIARIMQIDKDGIVKLRKVSSCKGKYTDNIGTPYTFQDGTTLRAIKKNWRIMSTEDILDRLFKCSKKIQAKILMNEIDNKYKPKKTNFKKAFKLIGLFALFSLLFKPLQLLYLIFGLEYLILISIIESIIAWEIFIKPIWRMIK